MPTQRPFLANFLAVFRAHSQPLPKAQPSLSNTSVVVAGSTQSIWTTAAAAAPTRRSPSPPIETTAKSLNPKAPTTCNPTSAAVTQPQQQQQQDRYLAPSLQHNVTPQTHLPRSPSSTGLSLSPPTTKANPQNYPTASESRRARRRGSDSSSDSGGFRDVRGGGEKWFVGGRTASGEERYYKLSMVKRERSADRISADQLSL